MRWTERQCALLGEIGIKGWWPTPPQAPRAMLAPPPPPAAPHPKEKPIPITVPRSEPAQPVPIIPPVVAAGPTATLDWPALRAAVAGCQACSLCESRTQTVFGTGHEQAHWMLVGEAPGEQEDRQGEPFVGKAGQLLDNMLFAVGLGRGPSPQGQDDPARQVYIANVLKCRPPQNRNPLPEEVLRCEPYLKRQVELVRPRLILAMGRFAVQSLLQTQEPIGRLRGRVHRYQGVPLVVTYHPAYLLRNPIDKAKAWEDLCLARNVILGHQPSHHP
ncbi:MAG: uracil-DNA glycosylase family protein [Leptothrix ochracea]|uniref:uracil-DNA glycosylase n=1 Tax=Leptothrix ochracea TaxID=735331 RepID=UPI0034E2AD4B